MIWGCGSTAFHNSVGAKASRKIPANCPRSCESWLAFLILANVSDIFYFFLLGERGKGESEAAGEGGVDILVKIPEGGGSPEGRRGREGVCGELGIWGGGGGGLNFFFSGPKCPPSDS